MMNEREGATAAVEAVEHIKRGREAIEAELRKRIVGQDEVVELMLISLFARGHCLFIGVPGLAKTLLISSLADALALTFKRIQFTPNLMPPDITGTEILQETTRPIDGVPIHIGPIFTSILLADEINRTPPKLQAALLQACKNEVTAAGRTHKLSRPFRVFATQNPIEQRERIRSRRHNWTGSCSRSMYAIRAWKMRSNCAEHDLWSYRSDQAVLTPEDILTFQDLVLQVPVAEHVIRYAVRLVQQSRPSGDHADAFVKNYVSWGAGPRASKSHHRR